MPLISGDRVLGTLNLGSRREGAFSDEDVSLLTQVAKQIAIAIDNAMAFRQLSQLKDRLAEEKSYLERKSAPNSISTKSWAKAGC